MAINPTAVWRVRPSGANTNGGGYDPGIGGAATDYSQQNLAQASGTNGTAAGTTTFTDTTANAFTAAMVGNALYITGSGFTTGWYFCTARASSSSITLDRSPGTGSAATWHLGGAWADAKANLDSALGYSPVKPGNIVYIFGAGTTTPNPSAYSYDYDFSGGYVTPVLGDATNGTIKLVRDPAMPAGAYPVIKFHGLCFYNPAQLVCDGLWIVGSAAVYSNYGFMLGSGGCVAKDCVVDQFGWDVSGWGSVQLIGGAIFSSVAARGSTASAGFAAANFDDDVHGAAIFKCIGKGILLNSAASTVNGCLIAQNGGDGITGPSGTSSPNYNTNITNNTIDGNAGDGINIGDLNLLSELHIMNNIISNHTGVGKYGLNVSVGSLAANDRVKRFIDYNCFYNNTTDLNNISYGAHTTHGTDPQFTNRTTGDYSIGTNLRALGFPSSFLWF